MNKPFFKGYGKHNYFRIPETAGEREQQESYLRGIVFVGGHAPNANEKPGLLSDMIRTIQERREGHEQGQRN